MKPRAAARPAASVKASMLLTDSTGAESRFRYRPMVAGSRPAWRAVSSNRSTRPATASHHCSVLASVDSGPVVAQPSAPAAIRIVRGPFAATISGIRARLPAGIILARSAWKYSPCQLVSGWRQQQIESA